MLDRVRWWRHLLVGLAALAVPVLVAAGVMGRGVHPERFDAKLVVVTPAGKGVRIHEVVDIDFGNERRHGYERIIPNDFGVPSAISASSPNASARIGLSIETSQTRIRLGDTTTTITGRHHYTLDYTLPDAGLDQGTLALDIIGDTEKLRTSRFEVVLDGFALQSPTCSVGPAGTAGGCTLTADGDLYRVVFTPLKPGDGVTVGGTITAYPTPVAIPDPAPLPPRPATNRWPLAAVTLVLGLGVALGTYFTSRRTGRDEIGGATAADAAYADPRAPTRLVTDKELEDLATTEFEPPKGIRPWQGALVLREVIDDQTVSAWFGDQIAQEVIEVKGTGKDAVLSAGAHLAEAPPVTKQRIDTLLGSEGTLHLGTYQPRLGTLWKEIRAEQKTTAKASGWWRRGAPGSAISAVPAFVLVLVILAIWIFHGAVPGLRDHPWFAIAAAVVLPGVVGLTMYATLLPSRTAAGSAVALRAESFRRFLEASEGKHVEWAWQHGLLREYSAWAVALGAADAWGRAVAASAVPPPDLAVGTMPLFMHTSASAWHATFTSPHSSSGGGGGGFSGGGGGGGSSGSW